MLIVWKVKHTENEDGWTAEQEAVADQAGRDDQYALFLMLQKSNVFDSAD